VTKTFNKTPTRVYLAGPMRGYPDYNYPAFHKAAEWLRSEGFIVWSPAEHEPPKPTHADPAWAETLWMRSIIREDLDALMGCDTIALLPNWEKSIGASVEWAVAYWAKLNMYELVDTGSDYSLRFMTAYDLPMPVATNLSHDWS
jgi:nucleoside 2-deoxyribosyltransferase